MTIKTIKKKKNVFSRKFSMKSFFRAYIKAVEIKAIFFNYPVSETVWVHMFLTCLAKEARIAGYHFTEKNKTVDIFLSYDLSEKIALSSKFTYYSFKGRKRMASLKTLEQFDSQNPTAFTLINTNVGLMTLKDCLHKKCGGEFLVTII